MAVGTTTTGAPGTAATVTNSGNSSAAVFNFTILAGAPGSPGLKGDRGAPGAPGPAGAGTLRVLDANNQQVGYWTTAGPQSSWVYFPVTLDAGVVMVVVEVEQSMFTGVGDNRRCFYATGDCSGPAYSPVWDYSQDLSSSPVGAVYGTLYFYRQIADATITALSSTQGNGYCSPISPAQQLRMSSQDHIAINFTPPFRLAP